MQRRDFLKRAAQVGAVLPIASSGLFARPLAHSFFQRPAAIGDRVLVLINLNGGNDGLNTIVPFSNPAYVNARSTIALKQNEVLKITDTLGLHNAMPQIQSLYNDGRCAIVGNVGYENQDRSHFRSTDIWHSASDADTMIYTGWLGRYLEAIHPEYPATLPTAPFAVQISSSLSLSLQSDQGNMGIAIDNPDRFYNLANGLKVPPEPVPNTLAGAELEYVRDIISQSNAYSTTINKAMTDGSTNVTYDGDYLSSQLKVVARLINGGLQTGIFLVTHPGFDTHQGQLPRHAQLLGQLSRSVKNFLDDLTTAGNGDRVAVMTYSEFGRRLNENGSAGTDHGAASPLLVFGKEVKGGKVLGGDPDLSDLDSRGDLKYRVDFRQVYASVLLDWLGFSRKDTDAALGGTFERLDLFPEAPQSRADAVASIGGFRLEQCSPNPATVGTTIPITLPRACHVRMRLFDANGREVRSILDRVVDAGRTTLAVDLSSLPAGRYLYTLDADGVRASKSVTVVR